MRENTYLGSLEIEKDRRRVYSDTLNQFYDKTLLYLSAGAIVLSSSFSKNIIGQAPVQLEYLLPISWGFLTFTIFLMVFSYIVAIRLTDEEVSIIDRTQKRTDTDFTLGGLNQQFADHKNKAMLREMYVSTKTIRVCQTWLYYLTPASFFFGLLCLTLFAILNVDMQPPPDRIAK